MTIRRQQTERNAWPIDVAIVLALAAGWIAFVGAFTGGSRAIFYDTFRDMAWVENMRAGRIWADPALPDQPYWYAPGNPLLLAGIATITQQSTVDICTYSAYWMNALLPILLYLLVRVVWDRTTALVALPAVFLGSSWWLTHALAGMPSVQAVALNLLGLLCWHRAAGPPQRCARIWPVLTGVVLALCTWHHPLCGIVLASTIFLHAAFDAALPTRAMGAVRGRFLLAGRMLTVAAVAAALTAPLTYHMLALPKVNPAPMRFVAAEIGGPHFYAHAHTPLVVPFALLGVWRIVRTAPRAFWIVACLLVGLIGQLPGFLGGLHNWPIPYLLPHEFQWHGHLALGICAAVGIVAAARAARDRLGRSKRSAPAGLLWTTLLLAAAVGPALRELPHCGRYLLDLESLLTRTAELRAWIHTHTSLDATFVCEPDTAYRVVSGLTGRKCVALPADHTNPAVNAQRRLTDVQTMLSTNDAESFTHLAAEYDASHLLLTSTSPTALEAARRHRESWDCLEQVFMSSDGAAIIYRIRASRQPGETS